MQRNNLAVIALNEQVPKAAMMGSECSLVRAIQKARGERPCFRTEKRLMCETEACEWRSECRRLVAVWKR